MSELTTTHDTAGLSTEVRRERMQRQARASKAEASWRAYQSDFKVWTAWAASNGQAAMPASPEAVAAFLSDMSTTRKPATLRRYLASLSVCHTLQGHTLDRKHAAIRTILRGASRENTRPVRRVKPLTSANVRAMVRDMGTDLAALRDAALLALGVASGLRRSELAALDWAARGDGNGVLALTAEGGATITLFTSKCSQAEPVTVHIQAGLALASVRRWGEAAGIAEGAPLFVAVGKGGKLSARRLSDRAIAEIVKRRAAEAGLDAAEFSGHSLRAGMVTSAALAGVPTWRIKRASRHKSNIVEQYIRPIEDAKLAITGEIGL